MTASTSVIRTCHLCEHPPVPTSLGEIRGIPKEHVICRIFRVAMANQPTHVEIPHGTALVIFLKKHNVIDLLALVAGLQANYALRSQGAPHLVWQALSLLFLYMTTEKKKHFYDRPVCFTTFLLFYVSPIGCNNEELPIVVGIFTYIIIAKALDQIACRLIGL